jgi:hypothetical protein
MATDADYHVRVTAEHIRTGLAGDCLRCAVALALDAATGDDECMVAEKDWTFHLCVWGRWIVAPPEVRRFVDAIDGLDREEDERPILPEKLEGSDLAPFAFTLPPLTDPEWQEECYGCEQLFDANELDEEGFCPECRAGEQDEGSEAR